MSTLTQDHGDFRSVLVSLNVYTDCMVDEVTVCMQIMFRLLNVHILAII